MDKIIEANCETGEVQEREMTIKEKSIHDSMLADIVVSEELAIKETQKEDSISILIAKLESLEKEVATLKGGTE